MAIALRATAVFALCATTAVLVHFSLELNNPVVGLAAVAVIALALMGALLQWAAAEAIRVLSTFKPIPGRR